MTRRVVGTVLIAGVALVLLGWWAWLERYHVILRNVRVVQPGQVYRGGLQKPGPLTRLIRMYHIRTILSLRGPCAWEERIVRRMGVEWVEIDLDEGALDENGIGDELEQSARLLGDSSRYPIYFHCNAGRNRSNMVHGAYRMIACGWTLKRTIAELKTVGFDPEHDPDDAQRREILVAFYHDRVLPGRAAAASQTAREPATEPNGTVSR
jgi:hypothetical protein